MTETIFTLLAQVGFTHPLHPALTHIPMGMVMGCFFFGLLAWTANKTELLRTAHHCAILALVFIGPTILAGLLDWQHRFGGVLEALIVVKMALAVVLTGLLRLAVVLHRKEASTRTLFVVYALCLVSAIGLGFSGGELVYGG
jgi:uncharacterized membrane protein